MTKVIFLASKSRNTELYFCGNLTVVDTKITVQRNLEKECQVYDTSVGKG